MYNKENINFNQSFQFHIEKYTTKILVSKVKIKTKIDTISNSIIIF